MQWLAKISVQRPVFATVIILALCVTGLYSLFQLGLDQNPNVDIPTITVTTTLKGTSAEEMDTAVTEEIEKQVNTISGIDNISSVSSEGISNVTISFLLNKSSDVAFSEVQSKVNLAIPNLPTGVDQPSIQKFSTDSAPIISYTLTAPSETIRNLSEYADKTLRPQLEAINGVGAASIVGGQLRQIDVTLDPQRLRSFDLTAMSVRTSLASQNVDLPSGAMEHGATRVSVRTEGRFESVAALRSLVVAQHEGQSVLLQDVAAVEDSQKEAETLARLNGKQSVLVQIKKQSGANTVAVIEAVKARIAELTPRLPQGYQIQLTSDKSVFIEASVHTVEEHLILGSILAAVVVLCFLRDWRSTLISALAIPSSIIATFTFMWAMGFTLNTITLLAFTLCVGIVIDDAILVLENIVRFMVEKNMSPREAAIEATNEIGLAVLATTLSLIAIFLPVGFMSGILGRFMSSFGLTMAFAIFISLIVAFTLTPMLCSRWLSNRAPTPKPKRAGRGRRGNIIENLYMWILRWSLRHRWVIVILCIVAFLSSGPLLMKVNKEFIPTDDQSEFVLSVRVPEGYSLTATGDLLEQMATEIRKLPDIKYTVVTVGADAQKTVNKGEITVRMQEIADRKGNDNNKTNNKTKKIEDEFQMMERVRREILTRYPKDLRVSVTAASALAGGPTASITYIISGPDMSVLNAASSRMVAAIQQIPGVADVDTSATSGNPELHLKIRRREAADLGVSATDLATTEQIAVAGLKASNYSEGGRLYDINLRAKPEYREGRQDLSLFTVPSTKANLNAVPFDQVVSYSDSSGSSAINRYARQRQITLSVNIAREASQQTVQIAIDKAYHDLNLGPQYDGQFGSFSKELGKSFVAFATVLVLAFIFIYLILAAQFESWVHPFTILISLPLSVPFALVSLLLTGTSLNLYSMLGILVLFGVVKKNSILQVDHANQLRAQGMGREEAVLQSSRDRLRPILMTTIAFVAGMLPLAFATGVGATTSRSAGDIIIGGQTLSLGLTLVATPVIYTLMDDLIGALSRFKARFRAVPVITTISVLICMTVLTTVPTVASTDLQAPVPTMASTGLQAPVPAPALPLPSAKRPILTSPGLLLLPDRFKTEPLTIEDVVALAIASNRTLALEVETYAQSRGSLTTARAGLGPTLSAGYSFDHYNQQQAVNIGGQATVTQQQNINQLNAALSLPIDITGELRAAVGQAKFQEIAARLEINRVRNEIVLNTKTAFYNVLRDQALVKVAQDSLQNAMDQLADAELRLSAGTVARFDVTRARTEVANARQTLIKSSNTLRLAFATLNSTIGIDIDTPLKLSTRTAVQVPAGAQATDTMLRTADRTADRTVDRKPTPPQENNLDIKPGQTLGDHGAAQALEVQDFVVSNPPMQPGSVTDYAALLKEALATRAEILREEANIAAARKGILVARSGLLPTVSVGYNLNYAPNGGALAGQELTGYAGLSLTVPLFDSGATRGRVEQARARVATAETNRRDQVDAVTLEVRQSYLNLQQAQEAIVAARQELAQADESYQLARLRYSTGVTSQSGVSPIVELSNAQQALSQAQSDYVNALYDFNNDRSALDKAVGRYSYTPGPLGFSTPPSAHIVGRETHR